MAEPLIDELTPSTAELDPDEALEESVALLDEDDLTLTINPPPTPLGKAPAYDFVNRRLIKSGLGVASTRREATLRTWIQKCIRTHAGAHPVHPRDFGLSVAINDIIGGSVDITPQDLEEIIREALTYHPAVTDVRSFTATLDPANEALEIGFTVELDDGGELDVNDILSEET